MRIKNNIPALNASNQLSANVKKMGKSLEKLSSGLRINNAADDAAGLAISEKMRAQIHGLEQAGLNSQDSISMIQTAEGALAETTSILQRMRELSVQSANDTLTAQDREYIQLEIDQLGDEINRIARTTQFNKKKLLDGSGSALWSASTMGTKLIVRGGSSQIPEGNYKISIQTIAGDSQVQKSNVLKIKHKDVFYPENHGDNSVKSVSDMPAGAFMITDERTPSNDSAVQQTFGVNAGDFDINMIGLTASRQQMNSNMLLEVMSKDDITGTVTFGITAANMDYDGNITRINGGEVTIGAAGIEKGLEAFGITLDSRIFMIDDITNYDEGDKLVIKLNWGEPAAAPHGTTNIVVENLPNQDAPGYWGDPNLLRVPNSMAYNLDYDSIQGKEVRFTQFFLNPNSGEVAEGSFVMSFGDSYTPHAARNYLANFNTTYVGQEAPSEIKLRDLDAFWDNNGKLLLDTPQTITLYQGDGKSAHVTVYSMDTIQILTDKINKAIGQDLGQASYATGMANFASHVEQSIPNSSESVQGTLLIRSVIPGKLGEITISASDELTKALGFNVIQQSKESIYYISMQNAHNSEPLLSNIKISGNMAVGILAPDCDIVFDPLAGIKSSWNEDSKKYVFSSDLNGWETVLHVADNKMTLQVGANEGEDLKIGLGNMDTAALGLEGICLATRGGASKAITRIDRAIAFVNEQRSMAGAWQNRLEHTMSNLAAATENMTASESRIRDLDMAKEMIKMTKLNILIQSSQSMLSQANQLPQNILALLR